MDASAEVCGPVEGALDATTRILTLDRLTLSDAYRVITDELPVGRCLVELAWLLVAADLDRELGPVAS